MMILKEGKLVTEVGGYYANGVLWTIRQRYWILVCTAARATNCIILL
jgi:hypothetical protein